MGRAHAVTTASTTTDSRTSVLVPVARALDVVVASLALTIALPLIAGLALLVRRSSHGPVLHRERTLSPRGEPVELFTFRTTLDGAGTVHHGRLRAVVGASDRETVTAVGRFMRATRTDRLPRLFNVLTGAAGLIAR